MTPILEKKILQKLDSIEKILSIVFFHGPPEELTNREKRLLKKSRVEEYGKGEYVVWRSKAAKL